MNNLELLKSIIKKYEYGNHNFSMVYPIEAMINQIFDANIHKAFILIESSRYDDGFGFLNGLNITTQEKACIITLLFNSNKFPHLFDSNIVSGSSGAFDEGIFKNIFTSASYVTFLESNKAAIKSLGVEMGSGNNNVISFVIDSYITWVKDKGVLDKDTINTLKSYGFFK